MSDLSPQQQRATDALRRADVQHRAACDHERAAYARRLTAVQQARAVGVPYRVISETIGITTEAVLKMLRRAKESSGTEG